MRKIAETRFPQFLAAGRKSLGHVKLDYLHNSENIQATVGEPYLTCRHGAFLKKI